MAKKEIVSAMKSYHRSLTKVLLTREEEVHYASIIQAGDKDNPTEEMIEAVNKMWEHNLRLVGKIAMTMYSNGELGDLSKEDAVAWGRIGLRRAAWKYNPNKYDNKFSTYARHWIFKEIRDAINTKGNSSGYVSVPPSAAGKAKRVVAARWKFLSENGRYPTNKELCELTGIGEGSIENLIIIGEWKRTQVDLMPEDEHCYDSDFRKIDREDEIRHMRKALTRLSNQEMKIIVLRTGLDGGGVKKLDDVGLAVGLTGERVRQIQNSALAKLRRYMGESNDGIGEIDYSNALNEEEERCQEEE